MKHSRRAFFAALLAPFVAPLLPKPEPQATINIYLACAEFEERYIRPACERLANEMNTALAFWVCGKGHHWPSRLNAEERRFDPARLPA